ncbi:amidase [candidate division KSB1 bacterium]|nr:amidase [candidate division KSB1 bacterium]
MANLGDLIGSLMSGLIRARRVADEQTAALAEYYKDQPLLEGLSVPRIRIPELTIDLPLLIEDYVEGEIGEMEDPTKIAAAAESQLELTLSKNNIKIDPAFHQMFVDEVKNRLALVKQLGVPIMKETIARTVQDAFADTLVKTKTTLTASEKETIARELRAKITSVSIAKEPVTPSIVANIKTADVKERASIRSVVRLKITMKEEGLEWAIQASESGGVVRTLQPE